MRYTENGLFLCESEHMTASYGNQHASEVSVIKDRSGFYSFLF